MGRQKSQNYQRGGDLGGLDCLGLPGVGDMAWLGVGGIAEGWGHGRRIMVKLNPSH